jgi:mono/diheme cytochrome c family protein
VLPVQACRDPEVRHLQVGEGVYDRYCSGCHGSSEGEGPRRVEGLEKLPPDLTRLEERHGSPLPRERIARFIDGRSELEAHGSREMPVWGDRLYEHFPESYATDEVRAGTIELILDYLESIQTE